MKIMNDMVNLTLHMCLIFTFLNRSLTLGCPFNSFIHPCMQLSQNAWCRFQQAIDQYLMSSQHSNEGLVEEALLRISTDDSVATNFGSSR